MVDDSPAKGAIIQLYQVQNDSLVSYCISSSNGFFEIKNDISYTGFYKIRITHSSAIDTTLQLNCLQLENNKWNKTIFLKRRVENMQEIIIKAPKINFKLNGDTITYEAEKYMKSDVRKVEDLLKNMEGFKIDVDGKIRYNGKEIKKLLIEGEDLTGDRYKVLSKNIQAGLISKIQVLQNFNDNRLLKEIEHSDQIALNLTLKDEKKNRVNGTADLAYSLSSKGKVDVDIIAIHKKTKALNFINSNNIGTDGIEDVIYYWDESIGNKSSQEKNISIKTPLKIYQLNKPDINKAYTFRNNDFSISSIRSIKIGNYGNIKMLNSISRMNEINQNWDKRMYTFPGIPVWEYTSLNISTYKIQNFGTKVSYAYDNKKNHISVYELTYSGKNENASFKESRFGSLKDSITEKLNRVQKLFSFSGNESVRISKANVLKIEFFSAFPIDETILKINNTRLVKNFSNITLERDHQQNLSQIGSNNYFDISIVGGHKKYTKTFGIHLHNENKFSMSELNNFIDHDYLLIKDKLEFNLLKIYPYTLMEYKVSKKLSFQVQSAFGFGSTSLKRNDSYQSFIYSGNLAAVYRFSALNQMRLSLNGSRRTPLSDNFFASPLISGHANILYGLQSPSFPETRGVQFDYQRTNLYKGTIFSSSLGAEIINHENSLAIKYDPYFTISTFCKSGRSSQMTATTFMEKYFHELRIKTNLNINFIYTQVPTFLNGELYDPRFKNGKVEFGMVSNWKGFFNIELNSSIARSIISGFKYEKRSVSNLERKNYSLKTIYRFGNKMHGAFYFSKQMNQKQKPFYMLDGNIECKISPGCIFSLTLHNIFNHTVFSNTEYSLYEYAERKYILSKRNILLGFQFDF